MVVLSPSSFPRSFDTLLEKGKVFLLLLLVRVASDYARMLASDHTPQSLLLGHRLILRKILEIVSSFAVCKERIGYDHRHLNGALIG